MSETTPPISNKIKSKDFFAKVGETLFTRFITISIGLFVSVFIARILGPEGQGLYATALALGAIMVQIGNFGISTSNTYVAAQSRDYVAGLAGNSLFVIFIFGTLINIIVYFLSLFYPQFVPVEGLLYILAMLWIYPGLLLLFSQSILLGLQEIRLFNLIDIYHRFIHLLIIGVLFYIGFNTVNQLFSALFVALILISLYSSFRVLKTVSFKFPLPSFELLKSTASYGVSAYLAALFSYLCLKIDLIMVKSMTGAAAAGFYSIAVSISDVVYTLPVVVGTVLFAKLSNLKDFKEKRNFAKRVLMLLGVIVLICIFIAGLLVEDLLPLLYGEKYRPSIGPFLYLLPGIFFLSLSTIIQNFIAAVGRSWLMFVGPMLAFIINIPLNFLWIPVYGAQGAAMASSVAYGLWFFIGLIIFARLKSNTDKTLPELGNKNDFILSIYSLTEKNYSEQSQLIGKKLEVMEISSLVRSKGIFKLFSHLRSLSIKSIYFRYDKAEKNNLLEIVSVFCLFAGASELVLFSEDSTERLGRRKMLLSSVEFVKSSLLGLWALFRSGLSLLVLLKKNRMDIKFKNIEKIFFLKANLWFGVKAGGSIGHVAGVVNGFQRLGYKVTAGAISKPLMIDEDVSYLSLEFDRTMGYPIEANNYLYSFDIIKKLSQSKNQFDVIYQRLCLGNFSGVILSRFWNIPLIMEYNGSEVWVSAQWGKKLKFHRIADWCEQVCLKHAHLIVTISDVLRDELIEKGIDPKRIVSYPNCIDPQIFNKERFLEADSQKLRAQYNISHQDTVITFVGTFGKWHGVNVLADSIARLVDNNKNELIKNRVKFLLIGDGAEMPYVKSILDQPQYKDFAVLVGLVDQHLAPLYLFSSDILVSPHVPNADGSRFFGSPTKLFEYMAMGKPIIASDLEQIAEVFSGSVNIADKFTLSEIEQSKALLVPPNSISDLNQAILYLLDHRELWSKLSANAQSEALRKYTWTIHVQQIIKAMEG